MTPILALVGQKNVGKSTLFNRLTQSKNALVADYPGLTRDRQYGYAQWAHKVFIVIDTGGLGENSNEIDQRVEQQCSKAIEEADSILFLVDGRSGLNAIDSQIAERLRKSQKKIFLVVNKMEGKLSDEALIDFFSLGLGQPIPISATTGQGLPQLLETIVQSFPSMEIAEPMMDKEKGIKIAILGRPYVGKSTLINAILGEERVIVGTRPGTTRDSILIPFTKKETHYLLIDTAGIRRRGKIQDIAEKFSVLKSLQAIESCDVALFLLDAEEGITDQDLRLLRLILERGRALVIGINKWDKLSDYQKERTKQELDRRLPFLDYVKRHFISAKKKLGFHLLFQSLMQAFESTTKQLPTSQLNTILQKLVERHEPPIVKGKRIKLRYAHSGGHNPHLIIIHGNDPALLPISYRRYLEKGFRKAFQLSGTPLKIEWRKSQSRSLK